MIKIRHRDTGEPFFEGPEDSVRELLERAVEEIVNLKRADLRGADLKVANLRGANLREVSLKGADLRGADLSRADLRGANLQGSNLWGADLFRANLEGAYLEGADLSRADLRGADLRGANLEGSDLQGADIQGTILDPKNKPNQEGLPEFERAKNGRCIGYRTRESTRVGSMIYQDRGAYKAPVFSTCKLTKCHPGLYVWPTLDKAREWARRTGKKEIVKVTFDPKDLHGVKGKWRVKRFTVIEGV